MRALTVAAETLSSRAIFWLVARPFAFNSSRILRSVSSNSYRLFLPPFATEGPTSTQDRALPIDPRGPSSKLCLAMPIAIGNEMRIAELGLAIKEGLAVDGLDPTAGAEQHRMAGRDVPLHGGAEPGIQVRLAPRDQAELDRAAGRAPICNLEPVEEPAEGFLVAMRT